MTDEPLRHGETAIVVDPADDAALRFIGRIRTPWTKRADCPRQGDPNGPICHILVDAIWFEALTGVERHDRLQVLYWMDQARRDLALLAPSHRLEPTGVFSLRAPTRPNPIASSIVTLVERRDSVLAVRGLDCLDGTPLLDLKPWREPPSDPASN